MDRMHLFSSCNVLKLLALITRERGSRYCLILSYFNIYDIALNLLSAISCTKWAFCLSNYLADFDNVFIY